MRRRSYLALAAAGALAGCLGGDDEAENGEANGNETGDDGESTNGEANGNESESEDGTELDWERGSFEPLWEQSLGIDTSGVNYDAVAGGEGLFVGHSRGLTAFGLDGTGRWDDERFAEFGALALGDDVVAALTRESELAVFDTAAGRDSGDGLPRGELRWSTELSVGDAVVASTVETGDGYVAAFDGSGLVTFDAETGERLATGPAGNGLYATGELLVVPTTGFDTALVGLDPRSGAEQYREELDLSLGEEGVLLDGRIFAPIQALDDSELVAIDAESGLVDWRTTVPNLSVFTGIGAGEGAIAALEDESEDFAEQALSLTAFDAADGTRRWSERLGDVINPFTPVVDGDTVVAETKDGVAAFDVASGERLGGTDGPTFVTVGVAHERRFFDCGTDVVGYGI